LLSPSSISILSFQSGLTTRPRALSKTWYLSFTSCESLLMSITKKGIRCPFGERRGISTSPRSIITNAFLGIVRWGFYGLRGLSLLWGDKYRIQQARERLSRSTASGEVVGLPELLQQHPYSVPNGEVPKTDLFPNTYRLPCKPSHCSHNPPHLRGRTARFSIVSLGKTGHHIQIPSSTDPLPP